MENPKKENPIKKCWNWLWHSDSIWSWVVSLILIFVIVKFVFFPTLSLILGTSLPLVVVESGSMHHSGGFIGNSLGLQSSLESWWQENSQWYESRNITKDIAKDWKMRTGMEKGDIIIVYGRGKLNEGDIIIFNANTKHPIIHRIINISEINGKRAYSTKGDNNAEQLPVEKEIPEDAIIGHAVFRIPKLGWLKLIFSEIGNLFSG